ncbi:MAG: SCO family protein [Alphaproteobacteria bacterium]|nr:SCO family protein [Alphaproteobacteria bacterium]
MPGLEPRIKRRIIRIAIGCVIGLAVAGYVVWHDGGRDRARMEDMRDFALNAPGIEIGGPFTLIDQNGKTVTEQILQGKYSLISFGFTYCPDVCPSRIQDMVLAIDTLGPEGKAKVQPVFITIDPARDDVKQMASYVGLFGEGLIGMTGSAEQIDAVAKAYKVYYAKSSIGEDEEDEADPHAAHQQSSEDDDDYMMDHTTQIYLMGPDGKFITAFGDGVPDQIAAVLKQRLQPGGTDSPSAP